MARPRIFVSSTYYDLKHIRSSLELFIESIGYEPVLSEKGDIAYHPDVPLDESCYREASSADIFVLIIGGRYGSEVSSAGQRERHVFFDRYDSITKKEYESASKSDIPIYILVDAAVHAEYQTYLRNRDNISISYAHVDSVNIFKLMEYIMSQPKNNPVFDFDQSSQIEGWLREQWAGLFREMLRSRSQQKQLAALTEQISELKAVNGTLKNYLEVVVKKVDPTESIQIIEKEDKKIEERKRDSQIRSNDLFTYIKERTKISDSDLKSAFLKSREFDDLVKNISNFVGKEVSVSFLESLSTSPLAIDDANEVRDVLGLPRFSLKGSAPDLAGKERIRRRRTVDPSAG